MEEPENSYLHPLERRIAFLIFFFISLLAEAHPGIGIVMDEAGNVYYTDLVHVWKIAPDGSRTIAVPDVHTHELYLDLNGDLYGEHVWYEGEASDTWGSYVWCLSADGTLDKFISDVEGFLDNNTLVRDSKGNTYWAQKTGEQDALMKQAMGGEAAGFADEPFEDIRWMYFSKHDQHLYVVDGTTVKKVAASGQVQLVAADLKEEGGLFNRVADRHYVFGLWTDEKRNVYAAVYGAKKVVRIDPAGKRTPIFESGWGWAPCGGLIGPDGSLWILEFSKRNATRVRKVLPNGSERVYSD